MQQMVITYVLSGLANIADVNPRDVHTSLFTGNVRVNNLSLRPETMNKLLPLPIEEGTVPEMELQIPNPSTASPMEVTVRRGRLLLQLDLSSPPLDRTREQIMRGITDEGVLGTAAADPTAASSEPVSPVSEREPAGFDYSSADSNVDEEDFASCASDGDTSDCDSTYSGGGAGSPTAADEPDAAPQDGGWLGYLRNRAAQSVEWIWRRQLRITFTDLILVLPCDARKNIHFEISVDSFVVMVEPTQTTGNEQMKIVSMQIGGGTVFASASDARSRVVVVESLSIKITTVYEANTERVLRKNVVLSFNGTNTLTADEVTLFALLKCHLSRQMRLSVPSYCLPFASLRARGSLWPYALKCVVHGLRDYKQRYNFNASHLRFYAHARERYVQLLNECHRHHCIEERRQELADTEQDLRYEDVILYLRRLVQVRYAAKAAEPVEEEAAELEPIVVSSTHFEWKVVKVVLPARNTVYASNTALVFRNEETVFTVASVSLDTDGAVQTMAPPAAAATLGPDARHVTTEEETSLVYVHIKEDNVSSDTKVSLQQVALKGSVEGALRCLTPIAEALQRIGEQEKSGATTQIVQPGSAAAAPPAGAVKPSTILAVHRVSVQLDDFHFLLDRLSCTTAKAPSNPDKLGCTLRQCYLRHKSTYVLAPVEVHMTPRGGVVVSRIALEVPRETWTVWRRDADSLRLVMEKLPRLGSSGAAGGATHPSATAASVASSNIDLDVLKGLARVLQWGPLANSPPFEIEDIAVAFHPLDCTIAVHRVAVQAVTPSPRGPYGTHITLRHLSVECRYTGRLTLTVEVADGVRIGSSPAPAAALAISVPSVRIAGRSGAGAAEVALLATRGLEVVVHNTVQYASVTGVSVASSVQLCNVGFLYKTDPTVLALSDRPCLTSYMQVAAEVTEVDVDRLGAVPSRALTHVLDEAYRFLCDEVVSEEYYRTFFSCFSDMALQVVMRECVVRCGADAPGGAQELLLSVANAATEERVAGLGVYRPHLFATPDNFPVLVLNDVAQLSMDVDVSRLVVLVSAPASTSPSSLALTVTGVHWRLPIDKMTFWREEVQVVPPVSQQLTVEGVRVAARLDRTDASATPVLEASVAALSSETFSGAAAVAGAGLSVSKDLPLSPSESDRGSCASSTEEQAGSTQVSVRRWAVDVDMSAALGEFVKLQHMVGTVAAATACFTRRVVLRAGVTAREFHLDDCGDVFFDAPTQMVVVEDCAFRAPSRDRHVVVCPGSSVLFRRCVFAHPGGADLMRAASRTALYTCEDCRVEGEAGASPSSATAPSVPTPASGTVADAGARRRHRTQVTVEEGSIALQLDAAARVVCTQRALTLTTKQKTRRSFAKARNGELRVEYVDGEQRLAVLTKTSIEGEVAVQLPRRACSASCSVSCGEVTLPLIGAKLLAVQERVAVLTSAVPQPAKTAAQHGSDGAADAEDDDLAPALYVVPPAAATPSSSDAAQQLRFPYDSWKVLLSLSLVPVSVQLPGGMTLAKVSFSNGFVFSTREPFAEAQLEARIAVHDLALWEWRQQTFQSVIGSPVFVGVQGRMAASLSASATASLSPVEAAVSTDQLKLLLHALSGGAAAAAEAPSRPQAVGQRVLRWRNFTGVALQARGGHGVVVRVPGNQRAATTGSESLSAAGPLTVTGVDGVAVDHVERDFAGLRDGGDSGAEPGWRMPEPLFVSRKTVVLADRRRFHVTSTLDRDLVHVVTVRTMVHVLNDTPLPLVLTAGGEAAHVVAPFELSCVPEAMLHRTDLSVAVTLRKTSAASLREPLLPESMPAADFYARCYQQGYPAADVAREFVSQLDGSSTHMVTDFAMRGSVLHVRFRPARPYVVNDTVYPVRVAAVSGRGEVVACEDVPPGERAYFLGVAPASAVRGQLTVFVGDDVYEARGDVALFDRTAAEAEPDVVVAHRAHPRRCFFELALSVDAAGPAGECGVAVTAGGQCLAKNCTTLDLFFSSDEGDSVGTMGTTGLPSAGLGSGRAGGVGYVPVKTVLRIKPKGAALSEAFDIDSSGEGCVIQCDHAPTASAYTATYVLLRTLSGGPTRRLAELLPAVVFSNRHPRHTLCVKHAIRQAGGAKVLEESVIEVPPLSEQAYYTLSKYGYTNDLLFAWRAHGTATSPASPPPAGAFSSVVETDLAPGTTWSGFVCVGATHHQVDITKGRLYDTAYVTVGPAVLPRVKLVNLSSVDFRDVARCRVAFPQPSKNNKYLLLTSVDGAVYTVDLLQEEPLELEPGVMAQTIRGDGDGCCVILSSKRVLTAADRTWAEEVQLSLNVQSNGVSLRLRDGSAVPLHLFWRTLAVNVMWWSQTTSLQSSVTGVSLESNYEGRKQQVVEPFDADVSLREMRRTSRDVYLKGFFLGLQPLTITVSDVLLYQLQMVAARCRVADGFDTQAWVQAPASVAQLTSLPASPPPLLHIGSAGIAETPLELSWDRSTRPPQDFLLGDSAISKLIPSLHHAMLVLPKLQLRNVSRVSPAELLGRVQQILVMEVVKQIPKMVTTVGLFKKNSSLLEKVTSTVSSLLFRSAAETDTTDDGGSALI